MLLEHSATKLLANDSNAKSLMPGARRTTKRRPAGFLGNRSIGCTALLLLTAVLYCAVLYCTNVIAIPLYWCTSRIPRKSLDQPQKKICCTVVGWRAVSPVIESSLSRSRRCCSHFDQNCDGWASFVLKIRSLTSKTSLKRKKCDKLLSK